MTKHKVIYKTNGKYTWLREPLLRRMPDGSLCCVFFTGGSYDGDINNIVAAVRSDDDGETWSDPEVIVSLPNQSAWAPSMMTHNNKSHIFWFSSYGRRYYKENHILSTGNDRRSFDSDRTLQEDWITERGVDIRHGTVLKNGKVMLPISWVEPIRDFNINGDISNEKAKRYANFGGIIAQNNIYYVGVMETDDEFKSFKRYGRISNTTDKPFQDIQSIPLFEPAIAELGDGMVSLLIRGDGTNRLWRADSNDGGHTWSQPYKTDIPNPGSKPRIINLPDGQIVLFHNPNEKDYSDMKSNIHKYRTPLEMWVSKDGMQSWYRKDVLVPAPKLAQYPDGFYEKDSECIYLAWEDDKHIYFSKIIV